LKDAAETMALKGLRTLYFAYKQLDPELNLESLTDEILESNMLLLGVTGVEDSLQDEVAQCIEDFR
jgi:magnesium-transporting ATPase (P-type)